MGGAQAIAALALRDRAVPRVDVIVGPGNLYVQEAKRQVSGGRRASTASPGPSDLLRDPVRGRRPAAGRADLRAQAEHGRTRSSSRSSDDAELLDASRSGASPGAAVPAGRCRRRRTSRRRWPSPRRSRPSTCS